MRALCPTCGMHHEVVRILDDPSIEERQAMYQVAPLQTCDRSWLSDRDVLDARAQFGLEAIVTDLDD